VAMKRLSGDISTLNLSELTDSSFILGSHIKVPLYQLIEELNVDAIKELISNN
jgi:hypothetical protein